MLTGAQQIDRLLRPGSKYSNLNPYNVRICCAWIMNVVDEIDLLIGSPAQAHNFGRPPI